MKVVKQYRSYQMVEIETIQTSESWKEFMYTITKLGQKSGSQWWSWKESIGYTMMKLGHMVLKGVIGYTM